jgi:hypothetical protein
VILRRAPHAQGLHASECEALQRQRQHR